MEVELDEKAHAQKQEREKQHEEAEDLQDTQWFRIFMTFVWIVSASVMIFYLTQIVDQYKTSKANPSSTILVIEQGRLPMPQIAICNWNQDGTVTDPTPTGNCTTCDLELLSCTYNTTINCSSSWQKVLQPTPGGVFTCWQYNADINDLEYSNTTGYSGSLATVWAVPLLERADPPTSRLGLQATFKPIGTITPQDIYNEVNFASMGFDTFFSLTYVNTIHNELGEDDPLYNTSNYDTTASTVNLLQLNDPDWNEDMNSTVGYVAVSFAYQTLSLQQVTFDIAYNLNNLFGDFSGMIGTLMGLDLIKVMAGLPMGYLAWKARSLRPLQEAFNG